MIDFEISTYWNVETLYYVFNGVAAIMAGAGFAGLLKLVFLMGLTLGIFAYAGNRQLEIATWFIQALIFVTLLNLPIARVAITDKTALEPPRVVDNVPFALAAVAQVANTASGWATQTYETVFGVPDELGLSQGDLAYGHRILKGVNRTVIRDPGLRADLMQFIKECTLYDIKDGVITVDQVVGQTDTWNTVFSNTSPARFVTYNTLTPSPTTSTCTDAANVLKARVDNGLASAQSFYGRQAVTRATTDALASSMYASAVGTSYDWILTSSASASDAMKQAMFNNIWREAGSELPALMSDPARVQELQNMAGAAQAARQADGSNATISMLAQETLPHMRNWLEAMIYALFPLVVVLVVVVPQEGAKKLMGGYMMSIVWIGLWPIMFAVINHLSLMHLKHKMAALNLASGVPFQLSDTFDATLGSEQAAIGYMVVLVPFLSAAIIKMGQGGFMSVADKMITGFSGVGASIGAGMASGNVSMGQAGIDTASVNTTSMHKYNNSMDLMGGGATIGYSNGGTATIAANGSQAFSQLQNRFVHQLSQDKRFQTERSQDGSVGNSVSNGTQLAVRHGDSTTFNATTAHDQTRGGNQSRGVSTEFSRAGTETGQHGTGQNLSRQLGDRSGFHMGSGAQDTAYMGLSLGRGSAPAPAVGGDATRPGLPSQGRNTGPVNEDRIRRGMEGGGATPQQVEGALANARGGATEQSYRLVTDDFGNQQKVPTGPAKPAAPAQPAQPAAKGAKPGRGGSLASITPSIGGTSQKTYSAQHSRERSDATTHGFDESARVDRNYSITGARNVNNSETQQSGQQDRLGRDASRNTVDERSSVRDVSSRRDYSANDRASRSESDSFSIQRDLTADPNFLEKVAQRHGMSAARFAGQEEGRQWQMIRDYAAEKGAMQASTTMPTTTFAGEKIPQTSRDLSQIRKDEETKLPDNIDKIHRGNAARTGFGGVTPVKTDTTMPAIATANEADVKAQLNPTVPGSMQQRAGALDENAAAWASADKKLGEGRANPMAVVEDMEGRDVKDTVLKTWDKITGGDGTADGEKLNDNMKRETGSTVQINQSNTGKK